MVASGSLLIYFPGDGAGNLGAKNSISAAVANSTVGYYAVGEFNGDTNPDILVAQVSTSVGSFFSLALLPGTGVGTYGPLGSPKAVAKSVGAMTTADLDGNGVLDAVMISTDTSGTMNQGLYVSLNSNQGLGNPTKYGINVTADSTVGAVSAAVGDFNGDLIPDVVACGNAGGSAGNGHVLLYAGQ